MSRLAVAAAWIGLTLCLSGCAPKTFDDPINVMQNINAHPRDRQAAIRQAEQELPDDPRRIAALYEMTWARGYEDEERVYAIRELVRLDKENFRRQIGHRVRAMQDWETIRIIFDMAVENQWTEFTPIVVQQYARPARGVTIQDRPERQYLEKLNPGKKPEDVIFDVFANSQGVWEVAQQVAAWDLLCRLVPRQELIARLNSLEPRSAIVGDLQAAARDLKTLPVNREGILWLMDRRKPENAGWWDRARTTVAGLRPEQLDGLELRHLPLFIRAANSPSFGMGKQELYNTVDRMIPTEGRYTVSPAYDGQTPDYPQRLADYRDRLTWGDLYVLYVTMSVMRTQPGLAAELFRQVDIDVKDKTTEYGGILTWRGSDATLPIEQQPMVVRYYPPARRDHDLKYLSSDALIEAMYDGFLHYHLHAQVYNNSNWAGPGRGDLDFADRLNFNCLVVTSIRRGLINVDYYQPGRVVVDIGSFAAE